MNKFIGVKLVWAEKQNSLVPSGVYEKGSPGYSVVYSDGYVSWCPEKVFDKANFLITNKNNAISADDVDNMIASIATTTLTPEGSKSKTTVVVCTLINGFTITESSACVDPANYDEQIGKEICLTKIKDKIWFLLGFLLQSALYGFKQE